MKRILIFGFISILFSCNSSKDQIDSEKNLLKNKKENNIVSISLTKETSILWDIKNFDILEYPVWDNIAWKEKLTLIDLISNSENTSFAVCNSNTSLKLGDVAFILIDKQKDLPYFEIFGVQWDSYSSDCKYPMGMFDAIDKERHKVAYQTKEYISKLNDNMH